MADSARVAAELIVAGRSAIATGAADGEVDHCILFTRIAVDLARQRGIRARALPVSVELCGDRAPTIPLLLGVEGQLPDGAPADRGTGTLSRSSRVV